MSNVRSMKNLDKLERLLRRFPNGIRIRDIPRKVGMSRSTVYLHLNTLDIRELARYERGIAYPSGAVDRESSKPKKQLVSMRQSPEDMNRFWNQIDQIRHEFVYGYPSKAYDLALHSYIGFPSAQKTTARKILEDAEGLLQKNRQDNVDHFLRMRGELKIKKATVSILLEKLSS